MTSPLLSLAADSEADAGADFEVFDRLIGESGPGAAIDRLIASLEAREEARPLLDALLLKARHELGLPFVQDGSLAEIPEPVRSKYEDRYVEAIRHVGGKLLEKGEIAAAWPYFRTIGEPKAVAEAIDGLNPTQGDETVGQIIEVAFNQGANPRRGWELILDHYGACSAITAFEHLPTDEPTRAACADRLVRNIHEQIVLNLRGEIARRGQPAPKEGTSIGGLLEGRPWLMADDAYHVDTSHLAATVRSSPILADEKTIALAVELTDYGRALSPMHRYEGEPPFEETYEDHAIYLRALLGQNVDEAIAHFAAKLPPPEEGEILPAQVLVRLLLRLDRVDQALEIAAEHLAGVPDAALFVPGLAQLCRRAGRLDRLADLARERGDVVQYAAAKLQGSTGG